MKTIKEVAAVKVGFNVNRSNNPEVYYLQVNDFDLQGGLLSSIKPLINIEPDIYGKYLEKDDLIFAAKGSRNFCYHFQKADDGLYVASSSFLIIKVNTRIVLPQYLSWYLNKPETIINLKANAVGTAIVSITKKKLEDFVIDIPSIDVQKQIIDLVKLKNEQNELYSRIMNLRSEFIDNKINKLIDNG